MSRCRCSLLFQCQYGCGLQSRARLLSLVQPPGRSKTRWCITGGWNAPLSGAKTKSLFSTMVNSSLCPWACPPASVQRATSSSQPKTQARSGLRCTAHQPARRQPRKQKLSQLLPMPSECGGLKYGSGSRKPLTRSFGNRDKERSPTHRNTNARCSAIQDCTEFLVGRHRDPNWWLARKF